jgi:hypothetical protein
VKYGLGLSFRVQTGAPGRVLYIYGRTPKEETVPYWARSRLIAPVAAPKAAKYAA